jgi:hypothetical protein
MQICIAQIFLTERIIPCAAIGAVCCVDNEAVFYHQTHLVEMEPETFILFLFLFWHKVVSQNN